MIKDIHILARHQAKRILAGNSSWTISPTTAIISINCSNDFAVFRDSNEQILTLHYDDITPSYVPILLSNADDLILFNDDLAEQVVAFTKKINRLPQDVTLLIHCYAGICRSGATGRAISEWLGTNEKYEEVNHWIMPNPHVLKLLRKKFEVFPYNMVSYE